MKNWRIILTVATMIVATSMRLLAETTPPSEDVDAVAAAKLGPGVVSVKENNGQLLSCRVIGQARISKVLGTAKGLEVARRSARLEAEKELIKWVNTHISSVEHKADETIIMLKGENGTVVETGKSAEVSGDAIANFAAGAVRGLTPIGVNQDGSGEMLTLLFGWSPQYAAMAADAGKVNESGTLDQGAAQVTDQTTPTNIPSMNYTSPDASKF